MAEGEERVEIGEDERAQWEEPQLDVTPLKEAMSTFSGTGADGAFNYS